MHTINHTRGYGIDRFVLRKFLSSYSIPFDVNNTEKGKELITLLLKPQPEKSKLPGIILLDIGIPGFDAWDFLDKINWLYPALAKPVEVYLLSEIKCPADIAHAKQYTFVKAFILKPVTKQVLQSLMKQKAYPFSQFTILEAC